MKKDLYFDSCGAGKIHACIWEPEGEAQGIFQIVHGIAEYAQRYDEFARYLNSLGFLVVAEDHMGHGKSVSGGIRGYFHGGWFRAVEDTHRLMVQMREEYPQLPFVLFGHSMGSFMVRTILQKYPQSHISACIICGTGWQPKAVLGAGLQICKAVCKFSDEKKESPALQALVFGSYNKRVERPRTAYDWLNRDPKQVDAYIADPMCGFTVTAGLIRDMLTGISYIQDMENLKQMNKSVPVFFIAGGDDPVGNYGEGVRQTADAFKKAEMESVSVRIYPLCRHEILNEINKEEVFRDIAKWLGKTITKN